MKQDKTHLIQALFLIGLIAFVAGCTDDTVSFTRPLDSSAAPQFAKGGGGPTVTSVNPAASRRDTTVDVQIIGSGFSAGSRVDFLLAGSIDSKIRTNSTRYVSSTELVANITIDASAAVDYRDVAVTTLAGKKGIGTEAFAVLNGGEITAAGLTGLVMRDVNTSGFAVGSGTQAAGCGNRGFVWSETTGTTILPLPAGYCASIADAISEGGTIIGPIAKKSSPYELARWTPDGSGSWNIEVIGRPATTTTWLTTHGVNDVGSISSSWKNVDGTLDSWYWSQATGWLRLVRPAGSTFCELEKMNNRNEMAGYCHTSSGNAIYWASPTSPAFQLPSPQGGLAGNAYWVSESGVVRGSSTIGGIEHTVLWIPDGSGAWAIQDLGAMRVADRNEQGSIVVTSTQRAEYTPAGGLAESLGVHLTAANLSNVSVAGTTWIVGYDDGNVAAHRRAYWFKR